jgi:hypothetical protein
MKAPFLCRVESMNVAHPKKAFNWCGALSCRLGRLLRCGPVRLPQMQSQKGQQHCDEATPRPVVFASRTQAFLPRDARARLFSMPQTGCCSPTGLFRAVKSRAGGRGTACQGCQQARGSSRELVVGQRGAGVVAIAGQQHIRGKARSGDSVSPVSLRVTTRRTR